MLSPGLVNIRLTSQTHQRKCHHSKDNNGFRKRKASGLGPVDERWRWKMKEISAGHESGEKVET